MAVTGGNSVQIRSVQPAGPLLGFDLLGDATLTRGGGGSAAGGWQIVDRPRRQASTQWLDYSPFSLSMDLILDGISRGPYRSIETPISITESWELPAGPTGVPPVLMVAGPVPRTDLKWVVRSLTWKEAIRDPKAGFRVQQNLSIELLEYVPAQVVVTGTSPAQSAQGRQTSGSGSHRRYTVRSGDTLSGIAAAQLGDYRRWPEIASLNGLRDPNYLQVGQVLALP